MLGEQRFGAIKIARRRPMLSFSEEHCFAYQLAHLQYTFLLSPVQTFPFCFWSHGCFIFRRSFISPNAVEQLVWIPYELEHKIGCAEWCLFFFVVIIRSAGLTVRFDFFFALPLSLSLSLVVVEYVPDKWLDRCFNAFAIHSYAGFQCVFRRANIQRNRE